MTNSISSEVDISQDVILEKFATYLKLKNRDSVLITNMIDGHCMGFTVLAMYALLLQLTKARQFNAQGTPIARDDWTWMKSALERLARWDGTLESLNKKTAAGKKLRRDTERLISLVEYFQNTSDYSISSQMQTHRHLYEGADRPFTQEYSFAGIFTTTEFTKTIEVPQSNHGETIKTTTLA